MKKFNLIFLSLLCCFALSLNAQYMKLDASFYSQALDEIKKVDIYLPADYYENLQQEYAVIYCLHGILCNQNSSHLDATRYYALHAQDTTISSPPAIFVCPDASCEPYKGSFYLNSELYGKYEDYTTIDLIEFIEGNFRAHPTREFRFIYGYSMGGFGSTFHATDKPELFRASFPFIGFPAITEENIILWRNLVYDASGSYTNLNLNNFDCQAFLTMAGGLIPNIELPPYYVDIPWDSTGAIIDTVMNRLYKYDASSKIKDIPQDLDLPFFLGCGITDYMGTYPLYLQFKDSLDFYGIPYQYNFFDGGHEDDFETLQKGFHWMDSIINYSFQTMGVEIISLEKSSITLYPNPAQQSLNISFHTTEPKTASIIIFNQMGQNLKTIKLGNTTSGNNEFTINISEIENGVYFLQLQINTNMITKKFIKH